MLSAPDVIDKKLPNLHIKSHDKSFGIPQSRKAACGYSRVSQGNKQMSRMRSAFWKRNKEKLLPGERPLIRPQGRPRKPGSESWRPVRLHGGRGVAICAPGHIWQYLETFWVVTAGGGGCSRHLVGTGQGHSTQDTPNTENHPAPSVSSAVIGKQPNTAKNSFPSSLKVLGKWSPSVSPEGRWWGPLLSVTKLGDHGLCIFGGTSGNRP